MRKLTEKQVVLGSALYILFFPMESGNFTGKRQIKKINRSIKKELAIFRQGNSERYLELVNSAADLLRDANEHMKELYKDSDSTNMLITPSNVISILDYRYNDDLMCFNIKDKYISELRDHNIENLLVFTIKYINKLMENIDNMLLNGVNNEQYKDPSKKAS